MKNLFHKRSIQTKLLWVIIVFVCTPLLVFGYVWYNKTTSTIEDNSVRSSQQLLKQTKEYLSFYLADLKKATTPLLTNASIQNYLKSNKEPHTRFDQYVETKKVQEEALGQIIKGRSDVFGMSLVSRNGDQEHNYTNVKQFIDMKRIEKRNKELWRTKEQYKSYEMLGLEFYQSTPTLTVVQKIYDQNTYDTIGLLVIDLHLNQTASILNEITNDHFDQIWLVDEDHNILYNPDSKELGETFTYDLTSKQPFIINKNQPKTLMVYEPLKDPNWTIVASVPLETTMSHLMDLRNYTIWIGLALVGLAILFVGGFSFTLTYSLKHLQILMRQVSAGQFPKQEPRPLALYHHDEISELYTSFYKMTEKLSALIQEIRLSKLKEQELLLKTKEAELQAMQSQINPHFLYNTLEIINSYAIIEDQMEISRMTTSLADMFRYNVSNTKKVVSLREELQHIKAYFNIQLERFEDLEVYIDVDDSLTSDIQTSRLTLQPLIENAFLHGYEEHALEPTFIGITGAKTHEGYLLAIEDHGRGMSPEILDIYNTAFTHHKEPSLEYRTTRRIGMMNVHKRIVTEFGHPYGLFIHKSDSTGTVVTIHLPYLTNEQ
ncbi:MULTISPECIES: sensor histidine kinase [Pontibacillus]|uniref:Histidine kinase n=1 Tax=Pontibacillus chungwhensis TaxID=265426 RepID=A0ABY8UT71_9BACI|nr:MULTISPECIES: sensor histidine kinase [Pontibacillus]MCD5322839.1 histidine kinase [Pontibacillus sp. HN14]WIF96237.1 histidine kinase [Pontibacillus chungwhensis]